MQRGSPPVHGASDIVLFRRIPFVYSRVNIVDLPQQGESLPDLDLTTESGEHIGTRGLTGQKTVLYFYPKDDTPGCTKEACAFRDRMDEYAKAGIQVYGISLDSPESHREFREKHSL